MSDGGWASFVSAAGLASLGCGAIFWAISAEQDRGVQQLESIHCHDRLDDLRTLRSLMPLLVAVRGRVGATAPRKCELSDKMAVMHEIVEEEVWRKERENGRVVNEPFEIKRAVDLVEWFLEDGSSATRVRVEGANDADRLGSVMQTHQVFVPDDMSKAGLAKIIFEKTLHMAKQGVRKTERFLPVGSIVTVVGELDRSAIAAHNQGTDAPPSSSSATSNQDAHAGVIHRAPSAPPLIPGIQIVEPRAAFGQVQPLALPEPLLLRRPASGGPFIITPLTLQQLRGSMSSASKVYRYAAVGLGAIGVALLARKLISRLAHRWRESRVKARTHAAQLERRRRLAAAASAAAAASGSNPSAAAAAGEAAADGGGDDDRGAGTCVVCMDVPSDMVFPACGHLCACETCSLNLRNRCPVCRAHSAPIRVYRS